MFSHKSYNVILGLFFRNSYMPFIFIVFIIFVASLFESFSISLIYPFMQLVSDKSYLFQNDYVQFLHKFTGSKPYNEFLIVFGFLLVFTVILINIITFSCKWLIYKFTWKCFGSVQNALMVNYLSKKYEFFISRDMSELTKNLLTEVGISVNGYLYPFVELISKLVSVLFIVTMLALLDPIKTLILISGVFLIYFLLSSFTGKITQKFGSQRIDVHETLYKSTLETFGSIKLIKAKGLEETFINKFKEPVNKYARLNLFVSILGIFPKYILEASFICSAILFILYELNNDGDLMKSLPIISVFAFSAIKILPYLQQIYSNFIKCTYNWPSVKKLESDCSIVEYSILNTKNHCNYNTFNKSLILKNVSFSFLPNNKILDNINLKFIRGSFNVICGKTGCGKSTLLDILTGLLTPSTGHIFLDGVKLSLNNSPLRTSIGYAPQNSFIVDSTVSENIAFGHDPLSINYDKIKEIAELTQISHLIHTQPKIGECGQNLSGGERQRIGIARALYDNPEILILDEATSAVDPETEKNLLKALRKLPRITIIMVTHRIDSLNPDDQIYFLEKGHIEASGKYSELLQNCSSFRALCGKFY